MKSFDLKENQLLIHYYFNDDTHVMNAKVRNYCEKEILSIVKTISEEFKVQIDVDVGVKKQGGIIDIYNLNISFGGLVAGLVDFGVLVISIIQLYISRKTKKDKEEQNLRIEHLKSEIELKKGGNDLINNQINRILKQIDYLFNENFKLKKQCSNFYKEMRSENKITKFESCIKDGSILINRDEFDDYILEIEKLDPYVDKNAQIEVISPVLKKTKASWTGIYKGKIIQFKMLSKEFKKSVLDGNVNFKNGTTIIGELKIDRKIDEDGNVIESNCRVTRVNKYFENENPIETPEGKIARKQKEFEQKQMKFDF